MAIAHLSTEDQAAVGAAYVAFLNANHRFSVPDAAWPAVLGPELFQRALEAGYFPPGTYPDLERDSSQIHGAQVQIVNPDEGSSYAVLYVDGVAVAREEIAGDPNNFDTGQFAERHGQSLS